ncbi:MAG TPA: branched-chain amino acid aminotransferase [Candidatus Methanoperedens sp.]|nr:branched-chain amino acid aminotransferase [Candidatus Methanoperedens sp.]
MEIRVEPLPQGRPARQSPDPAQLGFGQHFTDRMLSALWVEGEGWREARIGPYGPLVLDPSAKVFHYAQEVFEGLKAYRWADGSIVLFRPEMNAARFNRSAARLALPAVPEELFLEGVAQLVRLEQEWIPAAAGTALYVRPTLIAVDRSLGVKPSAECLFFVILSPVGAYYASGFTPVRILVEDHYVRAVPGGTGAAKTGGNYAASLAAGRKAKERGFEQVLWLDAIHRRYVEEVGAMNIFFVADGRLVTPPLTDSFLAGVTRDSVLALAPTLGIEAEERPVPIDELLADVRSGRVSEAFGTGTAAVVSPVGVLGYKGEEVVIAGGVVGPVTQRLYDTLTGIQYGRLPDRFGWLRRVA